MGKRGLGLGSHHDDDRRWEEGGEAVGGGCGSMGGRIGIQKVDVELVKSPFAACLLQQNGF